MNNDKAVEFAQEVAKELFEEQNCEFNHIPLMASEDFAYFCQIKKCAYAFRKRKYNLSA